MAEPAVRRRWWVRRHPFRTVGLVFMIGFLLLNVLAYRHAGAMLTYSPDAARTPTPQALSNWQKAGVLVRGVTVPRPENTQAPADLGLAAETVRFAADDGVSLEGWLVTPANPRGTVLLLPGYAAARSSLLAEGKAFHDLGYAALLVDFRGAGGSDGSTNSMGYHEAMDVAAAARYVRERGLPNPLVLYGQSMGGAALLRAVAALGVRPDAVIVESVFGRMVGAARNRFAMMGVPSFPSAELLVFWGGFRAGIPGFEHNPVDYARACDCPALVLHGEDDQHARPEEGRAIYENLAGRKVLVVLPGAAHTSLLRSDPEHWQAAVRGFLTTRAAVPPVPRR